jgi:hypothetical protein
MTDEKIDPDKVLQHFDLEFKSIKLDLICIDFNLEDEINGLDVLHQICQIRPRTSYMMYSSNLEQLVKKIIGNYDNDKDRKKLLNRIKSLTKYKIHDFVGRENYDEAIINWMSKNSQTLDSMVEEKLLEYPDLVFQNTYPNFQGKTLSQIAEEIRLGSVHGDNFIKELIEQAISNMVLINPYDGQ